MGFTKKTKVVAVFVLAGIVSGLGIYCLCNSTSFWHIVHLAIPPKGLYEPIVTDKYYLHEKGFSKEYQLKAKYRDSYSIGFRTDKKIISSKYSFSGKIKLEFYHKQNLIDTKVVSSNAAGVYPKDGNNKYFNEIVLTTFEIPLLQRYKDDISIRLTVIEPDEALTEHADAMEFFVAVSAIP